MPPLPLDNGVDSCTAKGHTPLIEATIANRLDLMFEHTLNVVILNKSDALGNTPLHYAVESGFMQGVVLLANQGCQLELFNLDHLTPLMLALKEHHIAVAEFLIKEGASPYLLNSKYESALNMAIEMHQFDLMRVMLKQEDIPEIRLPSLYVACVTAAKCDGIEYIPPLIDAGANLNFTLHDVDPPLNISAGRGNPEMVRVWLKHGASVESYDLEGFTPLMSASIIGCIDVCRILIDHGARIDAVSADGQYTAHSLALKWQQFHCAAYLASLRVS
nr:multiple ankyrin repeats single kh domain [Hymenolepis microstoma]